MSLSDNLKKGFIWSSITQFTSMGIQLLSTIILARLLTPYDYGLLGMVDIFIVIGNMIVDSGMGGALLRKKNICEEDYSTLFFYNMGVSILLYILFYISSFWVADFYGEHLLVQIIQTLSLVIFIHALSITPYIKILRDLNYKALTVITFISNFISLGLAIFMANRGFGVWSLIIQQLSNSIIYCGLSFYIARYKPCFIFSVKSFKEQFLFGINLLMASFLRLLGENLQTNVIAKYVSIQSTGYYVQANKLSHPCSNIVTSLLNRVLFPVFSKLDKTDLANKSIRIGLILIGCFL